MSFKQHFLYLADYEHWANNMLFGALDRLDAEARHAQQPLHFGTLHGSVDHLAFFYRKWFARLRNEAPPAAYNGTLYLDWHELKHHMRLDIRAMQRWLQQQPESFFDQRLDYQRSLSQEQKSLWVRDVLTHVLVFAAMERGRLSTVGSSLGAPLTDMSYNAYRFEMGEHVDHLHGVDFVPEQQK